MTDELIFTEPEPEENDARLDSPTVAASAGRVFEGRNMNSALILR